MDENEVLVDDDDDDNDDRDPKNKRMKMCIGDYFTQGCSGGDQCIGFPPIEKRSPDVGGGAKMQQQQQQKQRDDGFLSPRRLHTAQEHNEGNQQYDLRTRTRSNCVKKPPIGTKFYNGHEGHYPVLQSKHNKISHVPIERESGESATMSWMDISLVIVIFFCLPICSFAYYNRAFLRKVYRLALHHDKPFGPSNSSQSSSTHPLPRETFQKNGSSSDGASSNYPRQRVPLFHRRPAGSVLPSSHKRRQRRRDSYPRPFIHLRRSQVASFFNTHCPHPDGTSHFSHPHEGGHDTDKHGDKPRRFPESHEPNKQTRSHAHLSARQEEHDTSSLNNHDDTIFHHQHSALFSPPGGPAPSPSGKAQSMSLPLTMLRRQQSIPFIWSVSNGEQQEQEQQQHNNIVLEEDSDVEYTSPGRLTAFTSLPSLMTMRSVRLEDQREEKRRS